MIDMTEDKDMTRKQTAEQEEAHAADKVQDKAQEPADETVTKQDNHCENTASEAPQDNGKKHAATGQDGSGNGTDNTETRDNEGADGADGAQADAAQAGDSDDAESADSADSAKSDKKDKQIEELNDRYKRLFAEFDNFRKRTETEKSAMFAEGERTVLLKVLPLIDNFERALDSIPEEQKGTALADGIDKTYKAFMAQLKELGVTPIEACGKSFDANLHNAVMHVEDDSIAENTVTEELQKGYMFKDKVLRYSMVKVAN